MYIYIYISSPSLSLFPPSLFYFSPITNPTLHQITAVVFQGHRPHTERLEQMASISRTACITNQQIENGVTHHWMPHKRHSYSRKKWRPFLNFCMFHSHNDFRDLHFSLSAVKRQSKMPHLRIEDVTVIEMNWSQDCHGWTGVTHACNKSQLIMPVAHTTPT